MNPLANNSIGTAGIYPTILQGGVGGGAVNVQYPDAKQAHQRIPMKTVYSARIEVHAVGNGYVVSFTDNNPVKMADERKAMIATTLEEVRDIILAEMTTAQLERT